MDVYRLRHHCGQYVSLNQRYDAQQASKEKAVPEGFVQDFALLPDEADCGDADRDVLRRDHLAGYGARGIRGRQEKRVQVQLMRRGASRCPSV